MDFGYQQKWQSCVPDFPNQALQLIFMPWSKLCTVNNAYTKANTNAANNYPCKVFVKNVEHVSLQIGHV